MLILDWNAIVEHVMSYCFKLGLICLIIGGLIIVWDKNLSRTESKVFGWIAAAGGILLVICVFLILLLGINLSWQ